MEFIRKLFGIEDQSKIIEAKFSELQEKFSMQLITLKSENSALRDQVSKKEAHVQELSKQIRVQNEADLLLECEKIKQKILAGEKRVDMERDLIRYEGLKNIAEAQQRMMGNQGLSGFLGAAGNGIFR